MTELTTKAFNLLKCEACRAAERSTVSAANQDRKLKSILFWCSQFTSLRLIWRFMDCALITVSVILHKFYICVFNVLKKRWKGTYKLFLYKNWQWILEFHKNTLFSHCQMHKIIIWGESFLKKRSNWNHKTAVINNYLTD